MLMHAAAATGLLVLAGVQPAARDDVPACTVLARSILERPRAIEYWADERQEHPSHALYETAGGLRFDVMVPRDKQGRPCFIGARRLKDGKDQ